MHCPGDGKVMEFDVRVREQVCRGGVTAPSDDDIKSAAGGCKKVREEQHTFSEAQTFHFPPHLDTVNNTTVVRSSGEHNPSR